ncbi:MAG: hypothetical protein AAB974_03860 [Patescibacteria group bacterium]
MPLFFAELGRHPALSATELLIRSRADGAPLALGPFGPDILLLEGSEPPAGFAAALGGTIRFGQVLETYGGSPTETQVIEAVTAAVGTRIAAGKTTFGLSAAALAPNIPLPSLPKLRAWGLSVKKSLKDRGSARLITGTGRLLSPVAVAKNGLLTTGGDFLILIERSRWHLARTSFVHDFEGQAHREFDRPVANPASGMLPVQLARVLVNLSGTSGTLLDPFCGSGTVLGEAMLLGWQRVIGSDISMQEVDAARANMAWLANRAGRLRPPELFVSSAEGLDRTLARGTIDAIVTEPTLGPALRGHTDSAKLTKNADDLKKLYRRALAAFIQLLKNNGRVVMVFPRFHEGRIPTTLSDKNLSTIGYTRLTPARDLPAALRTDTTPEGNLRYARPDAKVVREIVLLEKKS